MRLRFDGGGNRLYPAGEALLSPPTPCHPAPSTVSASSGVR